MTDETDCTFRIKLALSEKYKMTDLGTAKLFLGLATEQGCQWARPAGGLPARPHVGSAELRPGPKPDRGPWALSGLFGFWFGGRFVKKNSSGCLNPDAISH